MEELLSSPLPMILIMFGIFWLLVWRPQEQERKAHEALLASLAKDDRVVLRSGLYGTVVGVRDTTLELEIAKNTRVVVDKQAVARRDDGGRGASAAKA